MLLIPPKLNLYGAFLSSYKKLANINGLAKNNIYLIVKINISMDNLETSIIYIVIGAFLLAITIYDMKVKGSYRSSIYTANTLGGLVFGSVGVMFGIYNILKLLIK